MILKGVQIGSFELIELLGVGGMGQVWRGRHVTERVDVAIKCLTIERLGREDERTSFLREAQSLSKLRHPHIGAILDIGALDRDLPPLKAGSPYMIMEYVRGEHLRRAQLSQDWAWLREIILQLLSALAHSHGRGIIHRDLKPSNVLVSAAGVAKLVDFGIARPRETRFFDDSNTQTSGTPKYMAPEQFAGEGRLQGAWTDLYSLGCLIWELVTGRPPFTGSVYELMTSHMRKAPAQFVPLFDVPGAFELWLLTLLEKEPRARFRRAADAIAAFESLPTRAVMAGTSASAFAREDELADATVQFDATATMQLDLAMQAGAMQGGQRTSQHDFALPAIPPTWRITHERERALTWSTFGEGLWGLSALPTIGREPERDALWDALLHCSRNRIPGVVAIEGDPGQGKSHLVEWFASRAHEVGAAHVLRAEHSEQGSQRDGLLPMFDFFLDTFGLPFEEKRACLEKRLPIELQINLDALARSLMPDAEEDQRVVKTDEREATLSMLLTQMAQRRAVVVILEDAHMGSAALRLVESFLARRARCPVLFVLTLDSESIMSSTSEQVAGMLMAPETRLINLEPLPISAQRELFTQELGLMPEAAEHLIARSQGKIVSALQLLGHWLEQKYLRKTPEGLALESHAVVLSEDIAQILTSRLEHLYAKEGAHDALTLQRQLELATALGREIVNQEWNTACQLALGAPASSRLVALLVSHNLAAHRVDGWAFTHELLRDCLEQSARAAKRWQQDHALIARVLSRSGADRMRLAHHQRLAGLHEDAIASLLGAAKRAFYLGEVYRVRGMLEQLEPMFLEVNLPDDHALRLSYRILLSRWERLTGSQTEATRERLERVVKQAQWSGDAAEQLAALLALAQVHENENRLDDAILAIHEGIPLARMQQDPETLATFLMRLGMYLNWSNRRTEALPHLEEARQISDTHRLLLLQVYTRHKLGHLLPGLGQVERARQVLEEALVMANTIGSSTLKAATYNMLGNLALSQKDFVAARSNYELASSLHEGVIERSYLIAQCNLGRLDIKERRWAECEQRMVAVLDRATELNLRRIQSHAVIPIVHTTSLGADLERWDYFMSRMQEIQNSVVTEPTCVELLHKTAADFIQRAEYARALRLLPFLQASYERQNKPEELAAVQAMMAQSLGA